MAKREPILSEREKVLLENAQSLSYQSVENGPDLSIYFYFPRDLEARSDRPLFLFFNSGGWDRGSVIQFAPQALYYVDRGAVCGLVQYSNLATHPDSTAMDSLQEGKTAIQFARHFSEKLHIDPAKVVAVGAGAGANIVGCATMKAHIPASESLYALSDSQPSAAILLSAIIDLEKGGYGFDRFADGGAARKASLSRYVASGLPPMLMIHGTADRLVPFQDASSFAAKMKRKKNPFELVEFEGRDQNFFNMNTDPVSYEASLSTMDDFLDRHGILKKPEEEDESRLISWRETDY